MQEKYVVAHQDIASLLATHSEIVEITKSEYIRLSNKYKSENATSFSMTINR